jgi:hypothetical protein
MDYEEFCQSKTHLSGEFGFTPRSLPTWLYDFQAQTVDWTLR